MKIAVFWGFARRNVGVHGQIPLSLVLFRVVFASKRSFLIAFLFGRRVADALEEICFRRRGSFRRSVRRVGQVTQGASFPEWAGGWRSTGGGLCVLFAGP